MKKLPRDFVERLKNLDFESIKGAVGEYLTDKEIKGVLQRRDLILVDIEERIQKIGEENVLY